MTDWAQGLECFEHLAPSHVRLGTYEDRIYGLPLLVETSAFAWNKDLYEAAPTSWAEIEVNAEAIRALGEDTYGFYF